ncbi:MAG: hypothetical protein LLF76_00175 [Planctomycetaceae bacterium]|nr:hypothetical protein [Planctomycetaceae bacterium]
MKIQNALVLALALILPSLLNAQTDNTSPYQWNPKVTSVMVFKNGVGFFTREGQVALRDGWCAANVIPPAAFGTLAIYSQQPDESVDIVAAGSGEVIAFDEIDAPKDNASKLKLLESFKFLKLQLTYDQKLSAEAIAAGKLVSISPEYVVLEADSGSFAVPLGSITRLKVLENPLRIHVQNAPAETDLAMAYLRKGITWIPEYTLTLGEKDAAELTLRGTLVNEAEDLVHCDLNFVVGVPHFVHTDYLSPVAVGQVVRSIGQAVPQQVMTQVMNRAVISNDIQSNQFMPMPEQPIQPSGRNLSQATGNLPQLQGDDTSDFTVYARKDITLRLGEKAIVTLFTNRIRYGHLYRWPVGSEIQHYLVLHNETDTPWTTGPCLLAASGDMLSEDLLRYVPRGGRGELPVTTAINIAHEQKESEAARAAKAHEPSNNVFYDLVTLNGELSLRNFGKTPAEMIVSLPLRGKPLQASDDGQIWQQTDNLRLIERAGSINWQFILQPGDSKMLTYTYERYVPSN